MTNHNSNLDQLLAAIQSLKLDEGEQQRLAGLIHASNDDAVSAAAALATPSSTTGNNISLTESQFARILAATASGSSSRDRLKLQPLENFEGEPHQVEPFLASISRHHHSNPEKFQHWSLTLGWILDAFKGKAERWGSGKSALVVKGELPWTNFDEFSTDLRRHFGSAGHKMEAQQTLREFKLGKGETLIEFVVRFRTAADLSGFNDEALISNFLAALPLEARNVIAARGGGLPTTINQWYELVQDYGMTQTYLSSFGTPSRSSTSHPRSHIPAASASTPAAKATTPPPVSDAMDIDGHRQPFKGTCYNCGKPGHRRHNCTEPRKARGLQPGLADLIRQEIRAALQAEAPQATTLATPAPLKETTPVPPKDFPPPQQ